MVQRIAIILVLASWAERRMHHVQQQVHSSEISTRLFRGLGSLSRYEQRTTIITVVPDVHQDVGKAIVSRLFCVCLVMHAEGAWGVPASRLSGGHAPRKPKSQPECFPSSHVGPGIVRLGPKKSGHGRPGQVPEC